MSDKDRAEVRHAAAERGRWRGEVVARRKDGTEVCVELITVALHGNRGEVAGFLGIHRDITDRKRADKERESRVSQQALVAELGLRALAIVDVQSLMDEAVALVARTLDVEPASVAETLSVMIASPDEAFGGPGALSTSPRTFSPS